MPAVSSPRWWSDRWAWRGALIGAPLGALAALLQALVALGFAPVPVLIAYAIGAVAGSGVGCLLGGPLGAVADGWRQRHATASDEPADDAASDELAEPYPDDVAVHAEGARAA